MATRGSGMPGFVVILPLLVASSHGGPADTGRPKRKRTLERDFKVGALVEGPHGVFGDACLLEGLHQIKVFLDVRLEAANPVHCPTEFLVKRPHEGRE
jgi:hypothetical protein